MWPIFHKLSSPKWFYGISQKIIPWLAVFAFLLIATGTVWGLLFAPPDYQQGDSFRIIYIHVPTSMLAESVYMMMASAGAISLIWKIKLADMFIKATAPIGASLTFLALFTGAVWGKPTWGTWWVWDARLTSMLILLFLYLGVMALQSAIEDVTLAGKAVAVLLLVGMVNIPIIKYSVVWWNTLHQTSTFSFTKKPDMPPDMWIPLLIMMAGFYCYLGLVVFMRTRNEILYRERKTHWVQNLISKKQA